MNQKKASASAGAIFGFAWQVQRTLCCAVRELKPLLSSYDRARGAAPQASNITSPTERRHTSTVSPSEPVWPIG